MNSFADAINFIFNEHESPAGGAQVGGLANMWDLMWPHLKLSAAAMAIACAISIPLGLWLGHIGKGGFLAINASNVGRAVPSLALIAFFVAYIGVGFTNLTLALVLLAIPPILTNTYTGMRQVDRDSVDSARGMGMTGPQVVRRVELPLALPLIFGGLRISAVNVIATATIAPLAGVVTLGDPIINVNTYGDEGRLAAALVVALLAVATEVGPRSGAARRDSERTETRGRRPLAPPRNGTAQQQEGSHHMRKHRWLMLLALLVAALAVAGCGDDNDSSDSGSADTSSDTSSSQIQKNDKNSSTKVTMGSKNFTEQKVLGEIYAQALAAAGYDVSTQLNLGDEKTALKALEGGDISAYPEYTGTALLSFFGVTADKLPSDETQAYDEAKAGFAKKNLTALPPTPFVSSNEVAVTKETADKYSLQKISDLEPVAGKLTLVRQPGVPPAARLPARSRAGLRPEVQEVRAGGHRPASRGPEEGPGGRVDRVHDGPAEQARGIRAAGGRQGHVPALQLDARRAQRRDREGGPRLREDRGDGEQGPHRRGDAGAERARRPRQVDARRTWPASTCRSQV